MRTVLAILVALAAAAAVAHASGLEERTGIRYQHDGGAHGDASDACEAPGPQLPFRRIVDGLLVPLDDPADHYAFDVVEIGRYEVEVRPGLAPEATGALPDLAVRVHAPGCLAVAAVGATEDGKGSVVAFDAHETGTWTVELALLGESGPGGVGVAECHPMCVVANGVAGYDVEVK